MSLSNLSRRRIFAGIENLKSSAEGSAALIKYGGTAFDAAPDIRKFITA